MEKYKGANKDSGIGGYEINDNSITVWFVGAQRSYTYSHDSAGSTYVENMKRLAKAGEGLNAYINQHVKFKYVR